MRPVGLLLFETWASTVPTSVAPPNTSSAKAAASGTQAPDPQTFPGSTLCFTPVGTHGHRHLLHPPERDRMFWHNMVMYGKKPADVIQKYVKKGNPLHVVGHIAYRTLTDKDKLKYHHTAIVIDSFTLLGRQTFQTGESAPDPDDGDVTVVVDANQSSELHDDNPF